LLETLVFYYDLGGDRVWRTGRVVSFPDTPGELPEALGSEAFPEPLEGFRKLVLGLPGVTGLRLLLPKRDVS
jgi:hypothetical protein